MKQVRVPRLQQERVNYSRRSRMIEFQGTRDKRLLKIEPNHKLVLGKPALDAKLSFSLNIPCTISGISASPGLDIFRGAIAVGSRWSKTHSPQVEKPGPALRQL
jgi:hypothetical protein